MNLKIFTTNLEHQAAYPAKLSGLVWPHSVGAVSALAPNLLHGALHVAEDAATPARVSALGAAVQRHRHEPHEVRTGSAGTGLGAPIGAICCCLEAPI